MTSTIKKAKEKKKYLADPAIADGNSLNVLGSHCRNVVAKGILKVDVVVVVVDVGAEPQSAAGKSLGIFICFLFPF